jgi:hypothetical protein
MKDRKEVGAISSSDVGELIGRFERSMIYDCHSFTARFSRSDARRELARRGAAVLGAIAAHLRKAPPSDKFDVRTAWGLLLHQIEISVDPKQSGPQKFKDTEGWISWAERFAGQLEDVH